MADRRKLRVAYDRPVDVLHVAIGRYVPYEGDGLPRGLELDYAIKDDAAVGAKVIGFRRNGWDSDIRSLAAEIGKFLEVDPDRLSGKIKRAIDA